MPLLVLLAGCRADLRDLGSLPDFALISQTGKPVTLADLKGKVWIADNMFTTCTGPCPMMSGRMSSLAREMKDVKSIGFLSFTVDPEHDTPDALLAYSKNFHASPESWLFLTGPQKTLNEVGEKGLHLNKVDGSLEHSTQFVLLDREAHIRGYYLPFDRDRLKALISDARALAGV